MIDNAIKRDGERNEINITLNPRKRVTSGAEDGIEEEEEEKKQINYR